MMIEAIISLSFFPDQKLPVPYPAILASGGVREYALDFRVPSKTFNGFSLRNRTKETEITFVNVDLNSREPVGFDPLHAFDKNKGKPDANGRTSTAGVVDWRKPHFTPSGNPLGRDLFVVKGAGMIWIMASSSHGTVEVRVGAKASISGGNVTWLPEGRQQRQDLAERLARWGLANMVGDRLSQVPKKGESSIRTFVDDSGAKYIRAADWAASKRYGVDFNRDAGQMSINTTKGKLTLFLGGDRAKLGESWLQMPEILPCRGTEVLIPASLVAKLN